MLGGVLMGFGVLPALGAAQWGTGFSSRQLGLTPPR